jgi:glutamine synthetase
MSDVDTVLETIRAEGARAVLFRFTDLLGGQRQLAVQASRVDRALLEEGVLIDGSAIPGWRDVSEADMLLRPDLASAFADPFTAQPALVLVCNLAEPATGVGYERCPRAVALRAVAHLAESGLADQARLAVEIGCFVQDETAGAGEAPGRAGYLAVPPDDPLHDLRQEVATVLDGLGVPGLSHHHGGAPGQAVLAFGQGGLVASADRVQLLRHAVHNVAASYGRRASFLPRPFPCGEGAGLTAHLSLWKEGRPIFAGGLYADLSEACLHFIGGVLAHVRTLNAFTNPTTNSYRRLAAGVEAPSLLAYAAHNRSAAISIPYAAKNGGKRIEIRFPDPSANPYLAFAAILMAGLDGMRRRLDPGDPLDRNLYDLPPDEADVPAMCRSLREALAALEADHDFLTAGEVISPELIHAYLALRRGEVETIERAPHPQERELYRGV